MNTAFFLKNNPDEGSEDDSIEEEMDYNTRRIKNSWQNFYICLGISIFVLFILVILIMIGKSL
jgi:hypothetical protein